MMNSTQCKQLLVRHVFRSSLAHPATSNAYRDRIERCHDRSTSESRALLYQTDYRLRFEHWGGAEATTSLLSQAGSKVDTNMPCDWFIHAFLGGRTSLNSRNMRKAKPRQETRILRLHRVRTSMCAPRQHSQKELSRKEERAM